MNDSTIDHATRAELVIQPLADVLYFGLHDPMIRNRRKAKRVAETILSAMAGCEALVDFGFELRQTCGVGSHDYFFG